MSENDLNAEHKIIEAAAMVFVEKGYEGARMQQIADKAGINKALLHYYYRSKDLLFEKAFLTVAVGIFSKFFDAFNTEGSISEKIDRFLTLHQDLLYKHRKYPVFFFNEITRKPELIKKLISRLDVSENFAKLSQQLEQEKREGIIRSDIEVPQLMINIVSLSVFPYIGRLIIQEIMSEFDLSYEKFLDERRSMIGQFVINSIKA